MMETTFWMKGRIVYRLKDNVIPQIWNEIEQGWEPSGILNGLIVGGDSSLDQVSVSQAEAESPGSTALDAKEIEIQVYRVF
jgi:hypothetical protein